MSYYDNKKLNFKRFSLKSLCLNLIVENFQKFHFAFTASKDVRLQRNLQFLQRRFSDYLAEKLLIDRTKTDAYFDFLINEHLSCLDFSWFSNSCYLKSIDDIFNRLPNLRRIWFSSFGDEILESVAKFCPRIVEIDASTSNVSDKGIKCLYETKNGDLPCPELKYIMMTNSLVTDRVAKCLIRSLPSIEKFDYPNLPLVLHSIHKSKLFKTQKMHALSLTELDFTDCKSYFTEVFQTCLRMCPKLESVICHLSNKEQLSELANTRLKRLDLVFYETDPNVNIDDFLKTSGCNLIYLKISDCTVSTSVLAIYCPALEHLSAINVDFIDDNDNMQPIFPSLTKLDLRLENPDVVRTFRLISSSSPKLKTVEFSFCILTGELKNQILVWCKSPAAKNIMFRQIHLEINFLEDILSTCRSMKWMRLWYCNFDVKNLFEILTFHARRHPNKPIIQKILNM